MPNRKGHSVLAAKCIDMRFGAQTVLENLSFSMTSSEAVGIVGPNGAGKTTLLSIFSGTYTPTCGTVSFLGKNVTALSADMRCRQGIVRTHQVPKPFEGMTIFENTYIAAAFGAGLNKNSAYDGAIDALQVCGLDHLANRRGETLGLLDRKRMELARALASDPIFLLLDEIGGGLTDGEASELVETIKHVRARNIGIIWIEHIVHILAQVVERLICMDGGTIIADGAPDAVMNDPAVMEAYLGGVPQ